MVHYYSTLSDLDRRVSSAFIKSVDSMKLGGMAESSKDGIRDFNYLNKTERKPSTV